MTKKRTIFYVGVAALLLSSCLNGPETLKTDITVENIPVELYNEIQQVPITRVNDSGFCDGDGVGVYVVNYENSQPGTLRLDGNQADNVKYVFNETDYRWIPEKDVNFRDRYTHVDIIGYYPYSNPTSISAYPFEISKDQSKIAAHGLIGGYEESDFLYAKASDVAPTASRIPLNFQHKMAGVLVTIAEGSGFESGEFAALEKAVIVSSTVRKTEIDLATGAITPIGEAPVAGIIPYKYGNDFRAVVVPQTVAANAPLFNITVDNSNYIYRKKVSGNPSDFTYIGGKLHKFTISVSKKEGGGIDFELISEGITAWDTDNATHSATVREYIVIHSETPGGLKDAIIAAGKNPAKVRNLKVTGKVDARDFSMMREEMSVLQSVNMKDVIIESFAGNDANCIPDYAFSGKSSLVRFVFPDRTIRIEESAFTGTSLSGSLILPESIEIIGARAFAGCSTLTGTLSLPKSLRIIGNAAFSQCSGIVGSLDLPESVESIQGGAFQACGGLTGTLYLPANLKDLGSAAFRSCSGFTGSLSIPKGIQSIGESTFDGCYGMNGILTLHDDLITIGNSAFNNCHFKGNLNLPQSLLTIGYSAFCDNQFYGDLALPASLVSIGERAFSYCNRLSGTLCIPEGIISISAYSFAFCSSIEGLILPRGLESIRGNAFLNCTQLHSIVCKASNPPQAVSDPFNGVAKDNFTVEVPESSVNSYVTAPVWKEFKRFAAHRDFSVSSNRFRTINAEDCKVVILRASSGESWSVESKPDWVTVSPSSGIGKTEVMITVSEMPKGFGDRAGEAVFLLNGKDYRSSTKVEQFDYQYGDGDVVTVQTATKGAGVNLVFMGDGFDAKDIAEGKYVNGINEAIGHFFDIEPYKTYRDYFNIYIIYGLSPDSGVGDINSIRETRFGSAYSLDGLSPEASACFEYACKAPTVSQSNICQTLITLIENTEDYGGKTLLYGDGSAIAICPMSTDVYPYDFRGLVQHEAGGHGFGKLGDEYIYHNAFIQTCTCNCCNHVNEFLMMKSKGWYENLSLTGDLYEVSWSHLIFDEKYANVVDIYEGGFKHTRGVFRSEHNSCMNNNIPYYSSISREAIVKRIMEYAGESYSFENFKKNDSTTASPVTRSWSAPVFDLEWGRSQHSPIYMGEKPVFNESR